MVDEPKPIWIEPRIKAAPKIRQIYWCDFWTDARLPEMWKKRPVIIISYRNRLYGPCLVLPTSSQPQDDNPWACKISQQFDGARNSWAICNQLYTVSPSRLTAFPNPIPLVSVEDFNAVLALLLRWLPKPFPVGN
jgi:mRNA interferase MazF